MKCMTILSLQWAGSPCVLYMHVHMESEDPVRTSVREESNEHALEIGGQAVWSVSSCKPGYGVVQLRDNSTDTYWQYEWALYRVNGVY